MTNLVKSIDLYKNIKLGGIKKQHNNLVELDSYYAAFIKRRDYNYLATTIVLVTEPFSVERV